ncbi:MAG: endo alpha-1,4 polygalactosaminidase [Planctomycetota bacterium]
MSTHQASFFGRGRLTCQSHFAAFCVLGTLAIISFLARPTLAAPPAFNAVTSWGYQLTGYDAAGVRDLVAAPFDLLVIDLARDGGRDYFADGEITELKQSDKIVLAYFEIGAIEAYRPEWNEVPEEIMAGTVDGWPKERYIKYWDDRWWPVVQSRVDRALSAGFDGAYLDLITAYDEIADDEFTTEERARRMVSLIVRISRYAKSKDADFKIVAQNSPELANWSFWEPTKNHEYLSAIDGLALESPFYLAHDKICKQSWCLENRTNAVFVKSQGKLLLGVDYAKQPQSIRDSYRRQRDAGFVPYVSVRALDRLMTHEAKND